MDLPKTAQRIRDLRTSRGMSLEELSRRVGVSKETVRLWEGGRSVRDANLVRLAEALGVAAAQLFIEAATGEPTEELRREPKAYKSLLTFLDDTKMKPTEKEREYLRSLRYAGDPGAQHWHEELTRYRKINKEILERFKKNLPRRIEELSKQGIDGVMSRAVELPPKLRAVADKMKKGAASTPPKGK